MIRSGDLELRLDREDTLIEGRRHRRYAQTVRGVPVYGGDVVRQSDASGVTISMFGTVHEGIAIPTEPTLDTAAAARRRYRVDGRRARTREAAPAGRSCRGQAAATRSSTWRAWRRAEDITLYFLDAHTGVVVEQRSDMHRQTSAVGNGLGVLGDRKKVPASSQGGTFIGSDRLRPPVIETFDMRGNLTRTRQALNGVVILGANDFASDADNDWTDGANVDAHAFAGYTYDYYFKRFGRRGLDNANIRIRSLTHPVNRQDALTSSESVLFTYFVNAFYAGDGVMVYGEGLPPNLTLVRTELELPRRRARRGRATS